MMLMLKGFSQEVSLDDPSNVQYMLVFVDIKTQKQIRLPVSKETNFKLMEFVYEKESEEDQVEPTPEEIEDVPEEPTTQTFEFHNDVDEEGTASI
jgi:hypothetical protein